MAGGGPQGTQAFASTLTDLMTSLAVIFILLLVVFLKQAHDQSKKARDEVKSGLEAFLREKSLPLHQDPEDPLKLSVLVDETKLRFPVGSYTVSPDGAAFVAGLFRTVGSKICDPALRDKVDSVVIEGHTDTSGEKTPEGVRRNIMLSQKRSFSVLESALTSLQGDTNLYECLLKLTSANGRGSRVPVLLNGIYNPDLSRRVEIKIQVRSAEQQFKEQLGSGFKSTDPAPAAPGPTGTAGRPVASPLPSAAVSGIQPPVPTSVQFVTAPSGLTSLPVQALPSPIAPPASPSLPPPSVVVGGVPAAAAPKPAMPPAPIASPIAPALSPVVPALSPRTPPPPRIPPRADSSAPAPAPKPAGPPR